jgi:hypothetical protein
MPRSLATFAILCLLAAHATTAHAQATGPITPPPPATRDVKKLPDNKPEAPALPPEEIIKRFSESESRLKKVYDTAVYNFAVRVQQFTPDGDPSGEVQLSSQVYTKPDGGRFARILEDPASTLKYGSFALADLEEFAAHNHFPLTAEQLPKYDISYAGRQQVDEVGTYMFAVRPKRVDRRERLFEGVVWVDDRDLVIVKTYGRFVTEVTSDDMFQMFESYREPVAGDLRLPTFVRSEGHMRADKKDKQELRMKLTLRYSDYQPKQ